MLLNLLRLLIFMGIVAVWLAWGSHYVRCVILDDCQPPVPIDSTALKKATHTLFLMVDGKPTAEGYPEFVFNYGSAGATYLPEHEQFLDLVGQEAQQRPQHQLLLIGRCTQTEARSAHAQELFENLARARALTIADKLHAEQNIPLERIEIKGVTMPDTAIFSPMQFVLRPFKGLDLDHELTEDEVVEGDTLVVPSDSVDLQPMHH